MITSFYQCWEIMDCDNSDCQGMREPETPCWEIAKREGSFHNITNTCRDCLVYIIKEDRTAISSQALQNILMQKGLLKIHKTGVERCVLRSESTGLRA